MHNDSQYTHEPDLVNSVKAWSQEDMRRAVKADMPDNQINEKLLLVADASDVLALSKHAVGGEWSVCQHLKSVKDDNNCSCGYRGNIWVDHEVHLLEMGVTPHLGDDMINTPSRAKQIATAQYICALHNWFTRQASQGGK